ncbi:MAG TPA: hypothetical protein VJN69_08510 [Candidatus Acidoferrales bacterium]|nr:hypothetical protein [Candidatus Acidoferrales bacterium]
MSKALLIFALVVCLGCTGCRSSNNGGDASRNPAPAAIAGKWAVVFSSTQNPARNFPYTAVETNLTQSGTTVSAGDQATYIIPFGPQGIDQPIAPLNYCGGLPTGSFNATIIGRSLTFTLVENGAVGTYTVTGTATIASDGDTISGTYNAPAACGAAADAGTLSGTLVPLVSGSYNTLFDTGPGPTLAITEDSAHSVTATGTYESSSFSLSGVIVGGSLTLSGNIPNLGFVIYFAYYLNPPLVSLVPAVNGISAQTGDFLIFGPSIGLATRQ